MLLSIWSVIMIVCCRMLMLHSCLESVSLTSCGFCHGFMNFQIVMDFYYRFMSCFKWVQGSIIIVLSKNLISNVMWPSIGSIPDTNLP